MIVPPLPENEEMRLEELRSLDILDTLPEEAYDAVTYLASRICDTPIALISLLDESRQWFKSRHGVDLPELPRQLSFCAHAILEPESMLIVTDASSDERFAGNPLIDGPSPMRFYAGAPLVTKRGHALGTLCVIDERPRTLTPEQQKSLEALSKQVTALLELRWTVRELKEKQAQLESVMRERETFLATVSHEIRTPLSAVIGYVGLLADPHAQVTDEERQEILAALGRQAGEVSHLIDDLLAAAKAESGSLRIQYVDVNLAAQVSQVLEGLDQGFVARVTVQAEPTKACGDPGRVRQIIRNLLTNADRYGGPDVRIEVRPVGDRAQLEVSDDGPGIPESEVAHVFQYFAQSDMGPAVSGSIGLGLPISRLLAEAMGGSLTYQRRDDRAVFVLDLPGGGPDTTQMTETGHTSAGAAGAQL